MSKAFDDWFTSLSVYFQYYVEDDSLIEDLKDAFQAGCAYRQEVDAKIAESAYPKKCISGEACQYAARLIREQKIDD